MSNYSKGLLSLGLQVERVKCCRRLCEKAREGGGQAKNKKAPT